MEKHRNGFRRNRTQEVAGSSPASSTGERPAYAAFRFHTEDEIAQMGRGQVLVK